MGKRVFKDPKQLREAWKVRMRKIDAQVPRDFRQFCYQCQQVSVMYMNKLVYNAAKSNARSGTLKRCEKVHRVNRVTYAITNDARTGEGDFYAAYVHYGRKAMGVPTPKGRKAYAWLLNRAQRRPASIDGKAWAQLVAEGKAVVATKLKKLPGKKWRDRMVKHMRGKLARLTAEQFIKIFLSR